MVRLYNLKAFAAEVSFNFAFKGDKALLVKNAPNKTANK